MCCIICLLNLYYNKFCRSLKDVHKDERYIVMFWRFLIKSWIITVFPAFLDTYVLTNEKLKTSYRNTKECCRKYSKRSRITYNKYYLLSFETLMECDKCSMSKSFNACLTEFIRVFFVSVNLLILEQWWKMQWKNKQFMSILRYFNLISYS